MPSVQHGTIWPADQHTLAKIALLRGYLNAYFTILGRGKPGETILYVDGFAGPGEYTNSSEGSPIAALAAASAAVMACGPAWKAADLYVAFIESDQKRYDNLKKRIEAIAVHPKVKPIVRRMSFADGIAELRTTIPKPFTSGEPLFVFIDPFGATGVPFGTVASILRDPCSEVLINLDADGIGRILRANNPNRDEQLASIYGDQSWRSTLVSPDFAVLCREVLDLYRQKLRAIPGIKYTFSYEMRGHRDMLNYHLVFASQNPLGLEKMKEAMKRIDENGAYCFSDGAVGCPTLFRYDQPEQFTDDMHRHILAREVVYGDVRDYVLNQTPFANPIQMLRVLHGQGKVEVVRLKPKGFSADHIQSIRFLAATRPSKPVVEFKQGDLFGGN